MAPGTPAPDLRESQLASSVDAVKEVVIKGALIGTGMPRFDNLSEDDVLSI